jgi:hypothetical protein
MNIQELTTWNRLSNLDFDAADAAFPFSARLARENGWAPAFAAKAIEEYRKFCFLAAHAAHPVTPSDEVDQVWHLHLTYSRHYWDTLCRDTLERSLHHGPTEGGAAEDRKFHDWYENTLASYRRYFGEPPQALWPSARERFDARHDFVRIDRRDVVTFDRALLKRGAVATLGAGALAAVANALAQASDAAASSGPGVFVVIGLVVVLVIVLVIALVAAASRRGRAGKRRYARERRSRDDAAAAAGVAPIYASSDGSHCPPGGDCAPGSDGGAVADGGGGGGGAGCGSGGGCGGGGGGCGGGGS